MYNAYVTQLKNVRPHPNADRLLLGTCFGNTVCVSNNHVEGELGVYFPTDGQLSMEFAEANNLLRKKDAEGNNIGGYMDPEKRNVTSIRLRGEKSDGLWLPLECLASFTNVEELKAGDIINTVNGVEICRKYIPYRQVVKCKNPHGVEKKKKEVIAPLFKEHADTQQLAYNLDQLIPGEAYEITLKMHGTSGRTAYLPTFQGYKRTLWDKITHKPGTPIYNWGYVTGTRRTVLENFDGGYYGDDNFRKEQAQQFEGKLRKGETVYYEIVGYVNQTTPIMGDADNSKTQDKEFIKQYGKTTRFSYGCQPGESHTYVYRMTMTNEDGAVVEYTPAYMRYRCEQMGVDSVPVFERGFIPAAVGDTLGLVEKWYDGVDPIGKTHVREGVVLRLLDRPTFTAFKHKNFSFKVLEGIAKVQATAPDMEEAQEVEE